MYEYLDDDRQFTRTVGSFTTDRFGEFKNSFKGLVENFKVDHQMDCIDDLIKILKIDTLKEDYKNQLIGDVLEEKFEDPYMNMLPQKLEQLFENSSLEILEESQIGQMSPITNISLPVLKKNFLECHSKDIVMTEVPTKPIVKIGFERKFLKDKAGNKYYIPEIFYNDSYKTVMSSSVGKTITADWYPKTGNMPIQDLNVLTESGGSLQYRDALGMDFCIKGVKITVPDTAGTGTVTKTLSDLNIQPNFGADGTFSYVINTTGDNGAAVKDILLGQVDSYAGTISISSTAGKVTQVQFGGHLSNENNTETLELDRERNTKEWKIPEQPRLNTGLSVEKIKDYKALFDIDITTEIISDVSTVLTQTEDSYVLDKLAESLTRWKSKTDLPWGYAEGFVETYEFDCQPPSGVMVTQSSWINTELKYRINRMVDELKTKLKIPDIMFVIYGHPSVITLLQDDVKWVIDEDTNVGGIQLDYRFGVMTTNKSRIHVISSLKVPKTVGFRIIAFPLTNDMITFKHYKYSFNIENSYRNSITPNIPNVMGVSRYLTTEVIPIQGQMTLKNDGFGRTTT